MVFMEFETKMLSASDDDIKLAGRLLAEGKVVGIPTEAKPLVKMLPYVVTVIVLIITSMTKNKNNQPPESLGVHYFREER